MMGLMLVLFVAVLSAWSIQTNDFRPETIIALERGALERWGKGDPQGFFDIMAVDQTYFDPLTARRVDGQAALKEYMRPFWGQISIDRFEMIGPKVQRAGDTAVLTFNLIDEGGRIGAGPKSATRWNCTEVFQRIDRAWKIVHSHWSYTKPALKEPAPDGHE